MSEPTQPRPDVDLSRLSGRNRSRTKNPAASAKILATGLSATAMLGMTAGYAMAARETTPAPATTVNGASSQDLSTTAGVPTPVVGNSAAVAPLAPLVPGTSAVTPQGAPQTTVGTPAQAPVVAQPQVVEIPVETIAPATPGNGGGGWNNQPSSGSN